MEKLEAKLAKLQYLLDNSNNEQKDEIKDVISEEESCSCPC